MLRGEGRMDIRIADKYAFDIYYILNTACSLGGKGAFSEAAIPRASTLRVSSGSMIPSSHNRAVL